MITVEWVTEQPWSGVRVYPSGSIRYRVTDAKEARDAIKQLRLKSRI